MLNTKAKKLIVSSKKIRTPSIPISKIFIKRLGFFFPSKTKKLVTERRKEIMAIMISFFWEVIGINLNANVQKMALFHLEHNLADYHGIAYFYFI